MYVGRYHFKNMCYLERAKRSLVKEMLSCQAIQLENYTSDLNLDLVSKLFKLEL